MTSEHNQGRQAAPTPPPPGSGGGWSRWGLYIGGGCAVATILGFLTVVVVVALVFFVSSRPATTEPAPQPEPSADPQPEPSADPQPEPAPGGGGLDELIQQEVGDFTLGQIEEIPQAIEGGLAMLGR